VLDNEAIGHECAHRITFALRQPLPVFLAFGFQTAKHKRREGEKRRASTFPQRVASGLMDFVPLKTEGAGNARAPFAPTALCAK
jgi:hypothetical protein